MKTYSAFLIFFVYFLFASLGLELSASSFLPIVTNFSAHDYSAGLQNWSCTQGANGEIYIGNNTGLLVYDGYNWNKIEIPGTPIVRSVMADGSRIYVGSHKEFGYFEKNEFGEMIFTSLHDLIKRNEHDDYDIWNILKMNSKIYFQSFSSWFTFDGKTVTAHYDTDHLPLYFHKIDHRIFVQMMNGDFYQLVNDQFRFVFSRSQIGNDNVVALIPTHKGHMILCTEWHGLFKFDGKSVKPYATEIDDALCSMQINRATMLRSDSTIVIGTILNGIYAISQDGKLRWNCNMSNRLHNNSVLRLFTDRNDNIWAALDNGISLIHTGSPYSILLPDLNTPPIGMVYGLDWQDDKMYIATNSGAYTYSEKTGKITPIDGAKGQNWHISHFDTDQIFIGSAHPKIISGGKAVEIQGASTASSTSMKQCRINEQDILLESSYTGFRVYRKSNGKWVYSNDVSNINIPIRQFEVDHSGTIWASHMSRNLYRIKLDKSLTRVVELTPFSSLPGGFEAGTMFVMKISGKVMFAHRNNIYTYDDIDNKIILADNLTNALNRNINSVTPIDDNNFWITSDRDYVLAKIENGKVSILSSVSAHFFGSECNETNNKTFIHNGCAYYLLNNAIARYTNKDIPRATSTSHLLVNQVIDTDRDKVEQLLPVVSTKDNPTNAHGDITFNLSYPNFGNSPIQFRYHITGNDLDLESYSLEPTITYGSLGYGNYHFSATVLNLNGEPSGSVDYYFTVPKPFYLSFFAIFLYIIAIAAITWFIARYRAAVVLNKRRKEYEAEKVKQDLKMMEQQRIIDQQQQQLLESELSNKGKEIASLALDLFTKDRAIESLREIVKKRNSGDKSLQPDIDVLLKQINTSNLQNKEFWDLYQANFDLIHENFFRNLRKRYPSLTSSDLKFCAFLRLNLTTKDIANVTNLTIRGVEAARYRLRKKLALPEGTSLVDFFIDFK